jgi:hypothetical protein
MTVVGERDWRIRMKGSVGITIVYGGGHDQGDAE